MNPIVRNAAAVAAVGVLVAVAMVAWSVGATMRPRQDNDRQTSLRPQAVTSADSLIAVHDCWTQDAPADMAGKVPGHVVVVLPNGDTVYGGRRLVAKALGQVFDGEQHGLSVIGFCR